MSKQNLDQAVRIIGGNWRSRKVSFAEHAEIRPTPARVRETLFNWLQYHVAGARCLELYAGSGILSLEALSRGAQHVTLVEKSEPVCRHLRVTYAAFTTDLSTYECHNTTAREFLEQSAADSPYDLIFLDPPFGLGALQDLLPRLVAKQLVADQALVYIESEFAVTQSIIPPDWEIHRQKRAGSVHYCLCRQRPIDEIVNPASLG
ncbi:16S rRNA (guanine(966)-N(2))-methyltransferase RsmD [Pseudomonadales bacterium]|nr:16S rRNA (guanine(966)-N(2))-methyltransferase RsmD [Pseudomonadales bacterium]MDA9315946.1 16S rRNA (guanine(966)-N(2))-methyltransferase RsmD [Pseudomonadales bacterium]MDA9366558.1 16S rRNA (guanine(966)-N(2))-methyltransferase RsmD [Pseudomonadales bacterium]MDB4151206.1 16S rRNA (guanine(966)-N(2))-methyltransferase RsmD [Pseudomonadales bacterium]MDB9917336.1 16S rRNA (guanine(966)-N(2))-methyltransferase RsmD [Pseudomonadales bacterium]